MKQSGYPQESAAMIIARCLGMEKIAWSLRRLHCPVADDALVLEVGSGGNPYYRSNVLLDAYEETDERHWVPLVVDRPTVFAFAEKMPFKDKVFDFVIASHVLEHSKDPLGFLNEMQRVAKGGYIEVPDAFMERINPYPQHRLEVTVRQGKLVIRRKREWQVDPDIVELYGDRVYKVIAGKVIPDHPFDFHVRYYWRDKIDFEVHNSDVEMMDPLIEQSGPTSRKITMREKVHTKLLAIIRRLFSQHQRNEKIDLVKLLLCPVCQIGDLIWKEMKITCRHCGTAFLLRNGIPDMTGSANGHFKGLG